MLRLVLALVASALVSLAAPAAAQDRIPSHCVALSQVPGVQYLHRASWAEPIASDTVRIGYVDHAMFYLRTPGGLTAMTDFTGFFGNVDLIPDVVTMNNAHSTHWTAFPDPAIPHVLEGWADADGPRDHSLDLGEMLVRNVHTDVRSGGGLQVRENGNSIFVFEVAGLCIGHLGHLHHEPDAAQYAALGRVDVVMVAVDGGLTLDHDTVVRIMERLRASVVIPMHWFGRGTLDRFVVRMEEAGFAVERPGGSDLVLSLTSLPAQPTVIVLEPALLSD
ncbi:MAG: putative Zn-dependent hydrolases of the beta-lactamase fold [Rhodobacteraceae bacterium HLUCCA08]|nr:MAG: putative Zn-dependent hydrolases of the beta-lactamase fold [Rhodobacteraceae bacterium HLUCCA08]